MGLLIDKSDFTGKYLITLQNEVEPFIAELEERLICEMLGVDLGQLFIADIDNKQPQTLIYQNLFNSFRKQENGSFVESKGMKDMLLNFIYTEYVRQNKFKSTDAGVLVYKSQEGREITQSELSSYLRGFYNSAITTYKSIQYWALANPLDYPLFQGLNKKFDYGF